MPQELIQQKRNDLIAKINMYSKILTTKYVQPSMMIFLNKNKDLVKEIEESTSYMEGDRLRERLSHLKNNFFEVQKCKVCEITVMKYTTADKMPYKLQCCAACISEYQKTTIDEETGLSLRELTNRQMNITATTPDPITGITPRETGAAKCSATSKEIMPGTNKTRTQVRVEKGHITLSTVNPETGRTGYKESGRKGSITRQNILPGTNITIAKASALKGAVKLRKTHEEKGHWSKQEDQEAQDAYRFLVYHYMRFYEHEYKALDNYNKRGQSGGVDNYQLDHNYSITQGFRDNVPPEVIGHICNLRMIPWRDNNSKHSKCHITLEELYCNVFKYRILKENGNKFIN